MRWAAAQQSNGAGSRTSRRRILGPSPDPTCTSSRREDKDSKEENSKGTQHTGPLDAAATFDRRSSHGADGGRWSGGRLQ